MDCLAENSVKVITAISHVPSDVLSPKGEPEAGPKLTLPRDRILVPDREDDESWRATTAEGEENLGAQRMAHVPRERERNPTPRPKPKMPKLFHTRRSPERSNKPVRR